MLTFLCAECACIQRSTPRRANRSSQYATSQVEFPLILRTVVLTPCRETILAAANCHTDPWFPVAATLSIILTLSLQFQRKQRTTLAD